MKFGKRYKDILKITGRGEAVPNMYFLSDMPIDLSTFHDI